MHELAVTQGVVDMITERVPDRRVTTVRLEIGRLSGVMPDAVRFCFDVVADGTTVQGAALEITEPSGRARCRSCGSSFDTDDVLVLCDCGSADVEVLGGDQLRILNVEVV
jgi:hydrogenase nickel incorporation protein HypA/HybF